MTMRAKLPKRESTAMSSNNLNLPKPPPGWNALQRRAQHAETTQELSLVIAEMNRLLSAYEASMRKLPHNEAILRARGPKESRTT